MVLITGTIVFVIIRLTKVWIELSYQDADAWQNEHKF